MSMLSKGSGTSLNISCHIDLIVPVTRTLHKAPPAMRKLVVRSTTQKVVDAAFHFVIALLLLCSSSWQIECRVPG